VDVLGSETNMKEMLKISKGGKDVPVILEDGQVKVGFGGS
jgi:hypothetical protein